jgi:hypothetical protein
MFDEQNIPKQSNSGLFWIFEFDDPTITNWGYTEDIKRQALLKEILEGKYQKLLQIF